MKRLSILLLMAALSFSCKVSSPLTTTTHKPSSSAFYDAVAFDDAVRLAYSQTAPISHGGGAGSSTGERPFRYAKDYEGTFPISAVGTTGFDEIASMKALEHELEQQASHNGARIRGSTECCGSDLLPGFSFWYATGKSVGVLRAIGRQTPGDRYVVKIDLDEFDPE